MSINGFWVAMMSSITIGQPAPHCLEGRCRSGVRRLSPNRYVVPTGYFICSDLH